MTKAGDPSRSRKIIRVIAAERFLRGVLLIGAGAYLLTHVGSDFEVYELLRKPSLVKATGIAVNLAIVAYLAHSLRRRLNLRGADLGVCLLERERR
jgi:uncharacterized membrane protein (DUF2068 family)